MYFGTDRSAKLGLYVFLRESVCRLIFSVWKHISEKKFGPFKATFDKHILVYSMQVSSSETQDSPLYVCDKRRGVTHGFPVMYKFPNTDTDMLH